MKPTNKKTFTKKITPQDKYTKQLKTKLIKDYENAWIKEEIDSYKA